jgi:hypothetical protein
MVSPQDRFTSHQIPAPSPPEAEPNPAVPVAGVVVIATLVHGYDLMKRIFSEKPSGKIKQ